VWSPRHFVAYFTPLCNFLLSDINAAKLLIYALATMKDI